MNYSAPNLTPQKGEQPDGYRLEIDGMRALAVVSVVAYHFERTLVPSGYLGVDIFFVISGYVITLSFLNRRESTAGAFLAEFYKRRVKRLLPALILSIVVTATVVRTLDPEPETSLYTGLAALFGVSNIHLWMERGNYFAVSAESNAFAHTWSLGVEEQFYAFFPLVFWFAKYRDPADGPAIQRAAVAVGIICAASFSTMIFGFIYHSATSYYWTTARIWELAAGVLTCLLLRFNGRYNREWPAIVPNILLTSLVGVLFLPPSHHPAKISVVVGLTSLIIACTRRASMTYSLLVSPPAIYLGRISYSLYLWHWCVLAIGRLTIGLHFWSAPFLLAAALLLATCSYHLVERPLRSADWSPTAAGTLARGGAALLASIVFVGGGLSFGMSNSRAPHTLTDQERFQRVDRAIHLCNMTPQYSSGSYFAPKRVIDSAFVTSCINSPEGPSARKFILVGDSFARQVSHHVARAAFSVGYDFKLIYGFGCPYPFPFGAVNARLLEQCPLLDVDLLQDQIVHHANPGDIVIVRLHFANRYYLRFAENELPPVDAFDNAIASMSRRLREKDAWLLLIGGNPILTPDDFQWLRAQLGNTDETVQSFTLDHQTLYYLDQDRHWELVSARDQTWRYFPTSRFFCSGAQCRARDAGRPMYGDRYHINSVAIDILYPDLVRALKQIMQKGAISK